MNTIDMTPSWESQVSLYLIIIENSTNADDVKSAREELRRIGRILDQIQSAHKEAESLQRDIEFLTEVD